jgi:hypothetical protein
MGAVLSQRQEDGHLHPIAFSSASFSPAQLNYDTHDKELLAIIRAFEQWHIFLEGNKETITVLTDHKNLEYWKTARTFNRCHACWYLVLAPYNFVITYRPRKQSQKPDVLSRRADHMQLEPEAQVMLPNSQFEGLSTTLSAPFLGRVKEALSEDPSLDIILAAITEPAQLPQSVAQKFKDYSLQEGLLLYQGHIFIPDEPGLKQEVMSHFHDSLAAGHQGCTHTLELIACHYYWPAMKFQVNCYMDSCEICQRSKGHEKHSPLQLLGIPNGPWEAISYDYIVKLPKSKGNDSILVVVNRFSKMAHFIPCKEASTAEDVAQLFLQHAWQLHGTPKCTVSDRGPQFNAKFLRALYKALQIKPTFSTAYHSQPDGQSECLNQWQEGYLRAFINHRQTDWADWLVLADFTHNNAQSGTIGHSPFQIVYGRSPVISPSLVPTGTPVANNRAQELAKVIAEVKATPQWTQEH